MGCFGVISQLCDNKRGVGYSVARNAAQNGYDKEKLPRFDRIPDTKLGLLPLALRFAVADRSVAVFTEGLGPQKHHGKTVLLVNEHSASATEMVVGFAVENHLATTVGVKTAGRQTEASSFKVGYGYRVALPWPSIGPGRSECSKEPVSLRMLRNRCPSRRFGRDTTTSLRLRCGPPRLCKTAPVRFLPAACLRSTPGGIVSRSETRVS